MFEALKVCMPITLMTFAIFTRSNMVETTGWAQISDTILVLISTCGFAFAMFGQFARQIAIDIAFRVVITAVSFVTMFHPNDTFVWFPGMVTLALLLIGIWRHREIAPPKELAAVEPSAAGVPSGDLNKLLNEGKRDFG
jgi:hypothetical protein